MELMSPSTNSRSFVIYSWESKRGARLNTVYIIHSLMLFKFDSNIISAGNFCWFSKTQLHSNLGRRRKRERLPFDGGTITRQGQAGRKFIRRRSELGAPTEPRNPFRVSGWMCCNQDKWLQLSSVYTFCFSPLIPLWASILLRNVAHLERVLAHSNEQESNLKNSQLKFLCRGYPVILPAQNEDAWHLLQYDYSAQRKTVDNGKNYNPTALS